MSHERINKQVVLVTGAASGIGKSAAFVLAEKGYRVIAAVRDQFHTRPLYDEMVERKVNFDVETLDVRDPERIEALTTIIQSRYNRIDVLINAVGYGLAGAIEDTSDEEAHAQFDTNFFGAHRVIRSVLPLMRIRKSGLIINLSSGLGKHGVAMIGFYLASKTALDAYSTSLGKEVKPFGIDVVVIEPTESSSTFSKKIDRAINSISELSPYRQVTETLVQSYKSNLHADSSPEQAAVLIERIIRSKKRRARYRI